MVSSPNDDGFSEGVLVEKIFVELENTIIIFNKTFALMISFLSSFTLRKLYFAQIAKTVVFQAGIS